jgi:hypothetical protein
VSRRALAVIATLGSFAACEAPDRVDAVRASSTARASEEGVWTTEPYVTPHNPVHALVLHQSVTKVERRTPGAIVGTVLVVSGSGDDTTNTEYTADVHDVAAGTFDTKFMSYDGFCGGMSIGGNGNPFITGGTIYDDVQDKGLRQVSTYRVATGTFGLLHPMKHGRWYDTVTLLGDGRFMVDSGWNQTAMNSTVEIYTPGSGWSVEYPMGWTPMFYPRQHLLPDGTVVDAGPENETRRFDPAAVSTSDPAWSHLATTSYAGWTREYGTTVLLPLTPENGWNPEVMTIAGDTHAPTATTERIDLGVPGPDWVDSAPLAHARTQLNAVLLPVGGVLVVGGVNDPDASPGEEDPNLAVLDAELYDPAADAWSAAGSVEYPHMYHSVAVLLPDATVWVAGGQYGMGSFEDHVEVYQPPYLFDDTDQLAIRPIIRAAPRAVAYGTAFSVVTDTADVARLVLVRPSAVTHAFDTDQRVVGLDFVPGSTAGSWTVTAPVDGNLAPPGYYMLFAVDSLGVPSVAVFLTVS